MSTIVAYKDDNIVHMMSDTQTSQGTIRLYYTKNKDNYKIFKAIGLKNTYFCKVGSVYEKTLLNTHDFKLGDQEVTYELLIKKVVPQILERIQLFGKKIYIGKRKYSVFVYYCK